MSFFNPSYSIHYYYQFISLEERKVVFLIRNKSVNREKIMILHQTALKDYEITSK